MEYGFTVGDAIDRIAAVGDGADFVEFGLAEAADIPERIDDDRLAAALDRHELTLTVHLPFEQVIATPVPEINDAIVAHQRRLLSWAGTLGAQKAVLHGTVRDPHDLDQRSIARDQIAAIAAAGREHSVEIVVENVGHQRHGLQLSVLGDLAAETDTGVCFDVGHAYAEEGNDGVDRFAKEYGDLISHLHLHDVRRRGDTHLPLGAGEIAFDLLVDRLSTFDGTVAIEVFADDQTLLKDSAGRARKLLR
jgi:Sugar phosphate isomerases/epimerases